MMIISMSFLVGSGVLLLVALAALLRASTSNDKLMGLVASEASTRTLMDAHQKFFHIAARCILWAVIMFSFAALLFLLSR